MSESKRSANEFKRVRQQLERVASELDELTVARLRAGRKRAVAAAGARRTYHLMARPVWWMPLTSAAVAALVTVTLATDWWRAPPAAPMTAASDDIELLATSEGPEFFDNIDFYRWIEDERDAG
jgi:hypothetical protein